MDDYGARDAFCASIIDLLEERSGLDVSAVPGTAFEAYHELCFDFPIAHRGTALLHKALCKALRSTEGEGAEGQAAGKGGCCRMAAAAAAAKAAATTGQLCLPEGVTITPRFVEGAIYCATSRSACGANNGGASGAPSASAAVIRAAAADDDDDDDQAQAVDGAAAAATAERQAQQQLVTPETAASGATAEACSLLCAALFIELPSALLRAAAAGPAGQRAAAAALWRLAPAHEAATVAAAATGTPREDGAVDAAASEEVLVAQTLRKLGGAAAVSEMQASSSSSSSLCGAGLADEAEVLVEARDEVTGEGGKTTIRVPRSAGVVTAAMPPLPPAASHDSDDDLVYAADSDPDDFVYAADDAGGGPPGGATMMHGGAEAGIGGGNSGIVAFDPTEGLYEHPAAAAAAAAREDEAWAADGGTAAMVPGALQAAFARLLASLNYGLLSAISESAWKEQGLSARLARLAAALHEEEQEESQQQVAERLAATADWSRPVFLLRDRALHCPGSAADVLSALFSLIGTVAAAPAAGVARASSLAAVAKRGESGGASSGGEVNSEERHALSNVALVALKSLADSPEFAAHAGARVELAARIRRALPALHALLAPLPTAAHQGALLMLTDEQGTRVAGVEVEAPLVLLRFHCLTAGGVVQAGAVAELLAVGGAGAVQRDLLQLWLRTPMEYETSAATAARRWQYALHRLLLTMVIGSPALASFLERVPQLRQRLTNETFQQHWRAESILWPLLLAASKEGDASSGSGRGTRTSDGFMEAVGFECLHTLMPLGRTLDVGNTHQLKEILLCVEAFARAKRLVSQWSGNAQLYAAFERVQTELRQHQLVTAEAVAKATAAKAAKATLAAGEDAAVHGGVEGTEAAGNPLEEMDGDARSGSCTVAEDTTTAAKVEQVRPIEPVGAGGEAPEREAEVMKEKDQSVKAQAHAEQAILLHRIRAALKAVGGRAMGSKSD